MDTGMLWFDNDPKVELDAKITRAADYYRKKFGQAPNLCLVNPAMLPKEKQGKGKIEIRPSAIILPNHMWIGVDKKEI
ncbi:MAG: hypothetical protein EPO32_05990 [Anaerolineae bacterium]|nr:MAG: hypothetical protein EPO32_05990 [Anaerolineae bacterium]